MSNTPGLGGYVVAWVVSVVAFGLLFAALFSGLVPEFEGPSPFGDETLVVGLYLGAVYSFPFALVGIPLVHLGCRRVSAQSVHVLAAGVAGLFPFAVFSVLVGEGVWIALFGGPAAVVGRWAVVPLVRRRAAAH